MTASIFDAIDQFVLLDWLFLLAVFLLWAVPLYHALSTLAGSRKPVPPADNDECAPSPAALVSSRQELFDADHSNRPRVGLTRRGK